MPDTKTPKTLLARLPQPIRVFLGKTVEWAVGLSVLVGTVGCGCTTVIAATAVPIACIVFIWWVVTQ